MTRDFTVWKSPIKVDLSNLQDWYRQLNDRQPPVSKSYSDRFGDRIFEPGSEGYGWSLQHLKFSEDEVQPYDTYEAINLPMLRSKGLVRVDGITRITEDRDYTKKTDCCFGYGEKIVDFFSGCFHTRVWASQPGTVIKKFAVEPTSSVIRVIISIETNSDATCNAADKDFNMPADGHVWMWNTAYYQYNLKNHGTTNDVSMSFNMLSSDFDKYYDMGEISI